ncbi:MAG: 30S ribosomal protein S5 [Sphaerochaeta sp.]|nr:30S ribosomal protein S5 [Spirochaetales bacterium]
MDKPRERDRNRDRDRDRNDGYVEKLIKLNRVAKVVKGGRRFSFSALVVVGDQNGKVGYGFGKANDVSEAIRKAVERAKADMIVVPMKRSTIPHEIIGKYKSASVLLKPAVPGTGVIAGGAVRAICDACGITDILTKNLGSKNAINIVKAAFNGFETLFDAKVVAKNRGKSLNEMWG